MSERLSCMGSCLGYAAQTPASGFLRGPSPAHRAARAPSAWWGGPALVTAGLEQLLPHAEGFCSCCPQRAVCHKTPG